MIDEQTISSLDAAAVAIPEILLPDMSKCDLFKWSVVACDQFTSQPAYWKEIEEIVGNAPSSLRLIVPEAYLSDNFTDRVKSIHSKMDEYLAGGIFMKPLKGFILTERAFGESGQTGAGGQAGKRQKTNDGARTDIGERTDANRWGLVLAIDLERYSFEPDALTLIRSTEGTVRDRLPPRIEIRRGAALEMPHVLLLVNDAEHTLIEPLAADAVSGLCDKAYDFGLMAEGGHIRGYRIDGAALKKTADALQSLLRKAETASKEPMLFAVGDGNHSLAAAKAYWEELKKTLSAEEIRNSPARCALVELINLHAGAVKFEPIHRALFNAAPQTVFDEARRYFSGRGVSITTDGNRNNAPREGAAASTAEAAAGVAGVAADTATSTAARPYEFTTMYDGDKSATLRIDRPASDIAVAEIQGFIDSLCEKYPDIAVDYIHGEEELTRLAFEEGCFCFKIPPLDKNGFFPMIAAGGLLPRKAFSMGEARDKRYYFEARRLTR